MTTPKNGTKRLWQAAAVAVGIAVSSWLCLTTLTNSMGVAAMQVDIQHVKANQERILDKLDRRP